MVKRPLLAVALLALLPTLSDAESAKERTLTPQEAEGFLRRPAATDPQASRVIARAEAAYHKLRSLRTISRDGRSVTTALLQRPRFYRLTQKLVAGELIGSAVSDGKSYYEYQQRKQHYLERDSEILGRLALPVNVRLFFPEQGSSNRLSGLDGKPTVREYGYRYRGGAAVNGRPAARVDVSVMVHAPDGIWHTFVSERYFDPKSGLLVRAVNGTRKMDIENSPNVKISPEQFRWIPPAGAVKGLG
jgi:hypothetical protein